MAKKRVPVKQPLYLQQNYAVGAGFSFEASGKCFALQASSVVELEELLHASMAFEQVRELLGIEIVSNTKKRKTKRRC